MRRLHLIPLFLFVAAVPVAAQIGVPAVGRTVGSVLEPVTGAIGRLDLPDVTAPVRSIAGLARDRISRLRDVLRQNRATMEPDERGDPARRGVVLMLDADDTALAAVRALGFGVRPAESFGNLGLSATELDVPDGMELAGALDLLRRTVPEKTFTADQLHFPSGGAAEDPAATGKGSSGKARGAGAIGTPVGMIDGGVGPSITVLAARGFAKGGPRGSDHGTAVASLLRHAGVRSIVAADVYGDDPAGGSALAIVRALDWMQGQNVPVVTISLAGPANPLLARAVAACSARGMTVVAAVGNDGPAAPPVYPASYRQVLAVTGVDGRNRALIEAGRAAHLDYAAPGADMKAMDARGRWRAVRGTSFAAPLVAARAAAAWDRARDGGRGGGDVRAALDREARDLGRKGADDSFGRGLLCGDCRPR